MTIALSIEKLHAIKGMLMIFIFWRQNIGLEQ